MSASKSASGSANFALMSSYCFIASTIGCTASSTTCFHRLGVIQLRFLLQQAARIALGQHRLAEVLFVDAGHDLEQRALACAVQTQHADLGPVIEAQRNIAQHLLARRMQLAHSHH